MECLPGIVLKFNDTDIRLPEFHTAEHSRNWMSTIVTAHHPSVKDTIIFLTPQGKTLILSTYIITTNKKRNTQLYNKSVMINLLG